MKRFETYAREAIATLTVQQLQEALGDTALADLEKVYSGTHMLHQGQTDRLADATGLNPSLLSQLNKDDYAEVETAQREAKKQSSKPVDNTTAPKRTGTARGCAVAPNLPRPPRGL